MRDVWSAQAWRVADSLRMARRDLAQLLRDVLAVGWCELRLAHQLEPDTSGPAWQAELAAGKLHDWCSSCGWCPSCHRRRTDLRSGVEVELP